jgi:hypothetical protein
MGVPHRSSAVQHAAHTVLDAANLTVTTSDTLNRAISTSPIEAPPEVPALKLPGLKITTTATLMGSLAAFGAVMASLVEDLPALLTGDPNDATKAAVLAGIAVVTTTFTAGTVTFGLIPEQAKLRGALGPILAYIHRQAQTQAQEHAVMRSTIENLQDEIEALRTQGENHRRAEAVEAQQKAPRPKINGHRVVQLGAFSGAGPGVTQTIKPQSVLEARIVLQPDGAYKMEAISNTTPDSFRRLTAESPVNEWVVVLPLTHDREGLEIVLKFLWSLNHYQRDAITRRTSRLQLHKLKVMAVDGPIVGGCMVVMPQVANRVGDLRPTVLQYDLEEVVSGSGKLAVNVNGPILERALKHRDEVLAQARAIQTGALYAFLGACVPDFDGRVSAEAIAAWLEQPMRTLDQLTSWRPIMSENPDAA